ncbi:MAG: hypothetical protein WDM90_21910 [Ferruginibacter sp.]
MESTKNMMAIKKPAAYDSLVSYIETPRNTFKDIRALKPDREKMKLILEEFIKNCRFENCRENSSYDKALGLKPQQQAVKETDMAGN